MYKSIYYDSKQEIIHIWDDTVGYINQSFKNYAFKKADHGSYQNIFGEKVEKCYNFEYNSHDTYEADLPVETKALIEYYGDTDDVAKNIKTIIIDIETDSTNGFASMKTFDKEITSVAIHDRTTDQKYCLVLDALKRITDKDDGQLKLRRYDSEVTLIEAILKLFEEIRPDIITGWNISFNGTSEGFDIPYLYGRIKKILGKEVNRLSPIGRCYVKRNTNEVVIAGVSCIDYMLLYKKFRFEPRQSYGLNAIGKLEVNKGKVEYTGTLDDLYQSDLNKFIEYNLCDVEIVKLIDDKFKFLDLAIDICHVGHVPYDWFHMSSRFIEGAIITYMRRLGNMVAPNKPVSIENDEFDLDDGFMEDDDDDESKDDKSFRGAYVKDPIPGLYSWVCSADINSLYPSTIMTLNISPETYVGKVENWDVDKYLRNELTEILIGGEKYTVPEFNDMLRDDHVAVSAVGALYTQKQKGIIPSILELWFSQRVEFKDLARKHSKEGNKPMEEFYNRRQHLQKIFLNSVYGILGLSTCRFYSKDNAESTTVTGQAIIKMSEKIVVQYFKDAYAKFGKTVKDDEMVIYIDTDSLYFSINDLADFRGLTEDAKKEFTIKICDEVADRLNMFYPIVIKKTFNSDYNRIKILGDTISETAFWKKKKAYALHKVYDMDKRKDIDKIEVKGISSVRSSFPPKFKVYLENFLKLVLNKTSNVDVNKTLLTLKDEIPNTSILDLSRNTSVKFISESGEKNYAPKNRHPFSVVKGTPAQVKAANNYNDLIKLWGLEKKVQPIFQGQKIKYVYLKNNEYHIDCLAMKADGTDPSEILDFIEKYVDKMEMYHREMKKKIFEFYDILQWRQPSDSEEATNEFLSFD